MPDTPAVQTEGLAKTYGGKRPVVALHPLTLTVGPGEVFGLLGPNGAGKTTFVKLLLGLVKPTAGTAEVLGVDVGRPEARVPTGYLPEGHRFPPFLTGREALALLARMHGVSEADRDARAPVLLDQVRLSDAADRRVGTYSKGMLQRLGIAQALMNRPRVVFLDEPTDGVDPVGRREIRDLIAGLSDEGVTVFLNSHLLSEVERVCTRVAILDRGALVREGTVDALTAVGRAWRVRSTPVPADVRARLGAALQPDPDDAPGSLPDTTLVRHLLTLPDRAALNAALDALRAGGVEVEAVEPLRQSLEDLFVDVVTGANDARTPAEGPAQ
ncbi:MAG TPA: ABC transporter ATP-binding protein [Rubricoccaceae bacterium]|jgi:ABC-2 type transport system ATP-binding protein